MFQLAIGDHAQDHGVLGIDMRAEGAGQADSLDFRYPQLVHQQRTAGIQRRLGQLDGSDVTLGDTDLLSATMQHVGKRPPVLNDTIGPLRHRTIYDAVRAQ